MYLTIGSSIEDGDEVLATPLTCTASNWPIVANNLKIKWVDIDPTTLNMDLEDLERKMTPKTKAIMGVHWGGYPLDLDEIRNIRGRFRGKHGWASSNRRWSFMLLVLSTKVST